jgi:hypothetical protein
LFERRIEVNQRTHLTLWSGCGGALAPKVVEKGSIVPTFNRNFKAPLWQWDGIFMHFSTLSGVDEAWRIKGAG